jgi:nitrogen fixation/metabolism regulation signal transduction histidine kinase
MKLRTKYLLFVCLIHLIALVLSFYIFRDNKLLFIASELVILFSIIISWSLYKELLRPLNLLLQGVDAIKARDFNVKFVPTGKFEIDQLIDVYNQMMDELRKERTRQEQQHLFLEKLIHTSPTGILILDYDDYIRQVNPKAAQLLGFTNQEVIGQTIHEANHPVLQQMRGLNSGESKTVTFNGVTTYKLQKSHFIDRGFARHFIMIEELSAEILAAEKKAYGKVIRMMAHEVNNTVGPVNSILQSFLKTKSMKETNDELWKDALQVAIDRNYNLNVFMRNFADVVRLPEPVKKEIDIVRLVKQVSRLMEMKAGEKKIRFNVVTGNEPCYILADQQQLEQVLINIVKNGMEAIDIDGVISILMDAENKTLTVVDTGSGIDPGLEEQIFSPFFSSKKEGQGIGLTLVKEILFNHGFAFSLKTVEKGRTEFKIRF